MTSTNFTAAPVHYILIVSLSAPTTTTEINTILNFMFCYCGRLYCQFQFLTPHCLYTFFYVILQSPPTVVRAHFPNFFFSFGCVTLAKRKKQRWYVHSNPNFNSPSMFPLAFLHLFYLHKKNVPELVCQTKRRMKDLWNRAEAPQLSPTLISQPPVPRA